MKTQNCPICGRELRPAPARHDGEPTYVGFFPCPCTESYTTEFGIIQPGTPEHEDLLKRYDKQFNISKYSKYE
jgi:hypothetical protein